MRAAPMLLFTTFALAAPSGPHRDPRELVAVARLSEPSLLSKIRFLADDLLEGRGPASRGDDIAMRYCATELEGLGFQPFGDEHQGERSWIQRVPIVGVTGKVVGAPVVHTRGGEMKLEMGTDFVASPGSPAPHARIDAAPLVFVGYGIVAPEEKWDDYAGVDVRGKVVVVLNNDPSSDPKRFGGTTRLYYGRWSYKYEEAARHGAVGAIVVHTTPSAAYPWQVVQTSWAGESFELGFLGPEGRAGAAGSGLGFLGPEGRAGAAGSGLGFLGPEGRAGAAGSGLGFLGPEGRAGAAGSGLPPGDERRLAARMWLTEARTKELLAKSGVAESLDSLMQRAEKPGFHAIPLDAKLSLELAVDARKVDTGNVLGLLPGTDPQLRDQVVVVTAHHDHLGKKGTGADTIYNGALDNASGVGALLELAHAVAVSKPRRGILFAVVGAEEQGLLGSRWLAQHPPVPVGKIAADLNFDGIDIWGKTKDVTVIGLGKSSLDGVLERVALEQGRTIAADPFPDHGSFYRSDQFSFAQVGVPAVHLENGLEFAGHDRAWGRARVEEYEHVRYHQPSDEVDATWRLDGAIEDLKLTAVVLLRLANSPALPVWFRGDEFEAARLRALTDDKTTR